MCGLILAPSRFQERLPDALDAMRYRGPGKAAIRSIGDFSVGHVRLPIRDLSDAAAQPYERERGGWLAFVGEIFSTNGAPELQVIDRTLEKGLDLFHSLDGFWSIAEISKAGAFAITDHLGNKPLYYWEAEEIVCSEIEPMFELMRPPELDEVYLSNCVKFGYDYSGRTPYRGIRQLPPGTFLDLVSGYSYQYWDWSKVHGSPPNLLATLRVSVANRLISDRPIGLLLSGGLDSTIIHYLAQSLGASPLVFSVENGESEFLPDGLVPLSLPETPDLREAVSVMQAPLDLGSLIPQIQLARAAESQGLNVVLTGDGADELFGGYRRSKTYDSQASDVFCELPYYHLPRLDRVMMRSTIEQRSPFLSPQVIATALRCPRALRTDKLILKQIFRGLIPDRILDRPKHPLKTQAVIQGGEAYRFQLVEEFRKHVRQDL